MDECSDRGSKVIVKSDQEPSIEFLVKDLVAERSEGQTLVEESPVGSRGSDGVVERAVQEVGGDIRALLMGLESRIGIMT